MIKSNAPILITAYNRSKNFKKLINSIKFYKTKIYVSIDGPKNDYDKVEQLKIINLIEKNKKKLKIKYRILNQNLGCQKATFSSLDWFFSYEKEGIILEDDNLPTISFFEFCNKLLIKYRKNKKIFSISGYSPYKKIIIEEDYFFSNIFLSWGWATWRNRWFIEKILIPNDKWKNYLNSNNWQLFLDDNIKKRYFNRIYNLILRNKIDSWSFLWLLFGVINKSKFILPKYNLVKNTGTQTFGANYVPSKFEYANLKTKNLKLKNFSKKIVHNQLLDSNLFYYNFRPKNQLYPWRLIFLFLSLFLNPKFFFIKVLIYFKKVF